MSATPATHYSFDAHGRVTPEVRPTQGAIFTEAELIALLGGPVSRYASYAGSGGKRGNLQLPPLLFIVRSLDPADGLPRNVAATQAFQQAYPKATVYGDALICKGSDEYPATPPDPHVFLPVRKATELYQPDGPNRWLACDNRDGSLDVAEWMRVHGGTVLTATVTAPGPLASAASQDVLTVDVCAETPWYVATITEYADSPPAIYMRRAVYADQYPAYRWTPNAPIQRIPAGTIAAHGLITVANDAALLYTLAAHWLGRPLANTVPLAAPVQIIPA